MKERTCVRVTPTDLNVKMMSAIRKTKKLRSQRNAFKRILFLEKALCDRTDRSNRVTLMIRSLMLRHFASSSRSLLSISVFKPSAARLYDPCADISHSDVRGASMLPDCKKNNMNQIKDKITKLTFFKIHHVPSSH